MFVIGGTGLRPRRGAHHRKLYRQEFMENYRKRRKDMEKALSALRRSAGYGLFGGLGILAWAGMLLCENWFQFRGNSMWVTGGLPSATAVAKRRLAAAHCYWFYCAHYRSNCMEVFIDVL